jgi:hypothetical protein
MTPLDFLSAVLPAPGTGVYCVAELSSPKKDHQYEETIEALEAPIDAWHAAKRDVYFALSVFAEEGKRTADNARFIKALFIDMDGYESKKEAAQALTAFLEATGMDVLGSPYIVGSGGGLHVYWPFEEAVDIVSWKPVAENFKRLCKQEGMAIDMTVTADAARVLRVPGTTNFKKKYGTPRPVRLLVEGDVFKFDQLADLINDKLTAPAYTAPKNVIELPGMRPAAAPVTASATSMKLFENNSTKFKTIWLATQRGEGCGQLEHYALNAAEDGMEPLWRGLLSITQKCDDGNKAAGWLSQMHPYPPERMHAKLREIKGPYPCIKFDSENPGICTDCRHWGKITNPLALGREVRISTEEKDVPINNAVINDAVPNETRTVKRPPAPKGYAYGDRGGVYVERLVEQDDGTKAKKMVPILPYDLFVVDILNSQNDHSVHMVAMRPEGPVDLIMPQKAVVSKDETVKSLAQQNIIASFGAGNDKNLFEYVRACVEDASTNKVAVKVPASYGWQTDGTYVFAGRIFSNARPAFTLPMPGLENLQSFTEPAGTIDNWRKFINLLIAKKMYKHLAVVLAGAGAPLMRYTKLFGMTFHCASTESGTGKSLALEAAASVWGHPTRYRTGKSTSPVAMQQRLGLLQNHPLITDELTSKNRENFEWLPEFLLDMTQGKGKERMEAGSNKERLNLSTWATTALLSSNTHMVDILTGGRKHAAEGELRRLLEVLMEDPLSWEPHEIETLKSLQDNYGTAGVMMIDYMVNNEALLEPLVTATVTRMYQEFNATNDERFWMAGIGASVAAGALWSSSYAGIVDLPLKEIIKAFHDAVKYMRKAMKASTRAAEDVLNAYTGENYGKFVVVKRSDGSLLAQLGGNQEIDQSITRTSVAGRIEHEITAGFVDYYIEEALLKAYCATMSFGYAAFCKQLSEADGFFVERMKKDMTSKTKGPPMRVNALKIRRRSGDWDAEALPLPLAAA